jgi:hypothetical protein
MSNVFTADLTQMVETVLAEGRARKAGVSASEALTLLSAAGYDVPGDSPETQAINLRGLFAWVNPSVGSSKRGPKGGFAPAEYATAASKKPQGAIGTVNSLKKQGVTDEQIREALAQISAQTSDSDTSEAAE